jgi:hypothetical protein
MGGVSQPALPNEPGAKRRPDAGPGTAVVATVATFTSDIMQRTRIVVRTTCSLQSKSGAKGAALWRGCVFGLVYAFLRRRRRIRPRPARAVPNNASDAGSGTVVVKENAFVRIEDCAVPVLAWSA